MGEKMFSDQRREGVAAVTPPKGSRCDAGLGFFLGSRGDRCRAAGVFKTFLVACPRCERGVLKKNVFAAKKGNYLKPESSLFYPAFEGFYIRFVNFKTDIVNS